MAGRPGTYLAVFAVHPDKGIYGTRVTSAGVSLDPNGFVISSAAGSYGTHAPAVAWGGTDFFVVWPFKGGIRGARVVP